MTTEKRKPAHDLRASKAAFADLDNFNGTGTAVRGAAALGFGRAEIVAAIQTMQPSNFYKSMTAYGSQHIWHDVYHVPSEAGTFTLNSRPIPRPDTCCCRLKRKTMSNPHCPKTGAPMQRGLRPMTLDYKGAQMTFDMPGWYCDSSEESIHTGEDLKISDRALNRLKAEADGLPFPEEIKRIRGKLGLTQEQAGELIGGGPRAFQKYEAGELLPSRAIASVLALLDHDPSGIEILRTRPQRSWQGK